MCLGGDEYDDDDSVLDDSVLDEAVTVRDPAQDNHPLQEYYQERAHDTYVLGADLLRLRRDEQLTVYNGVLVIFDGDQDLRVLRLVDSLYYETGMRLLAVRENAGDVIFYWKDYVPASLENRKELDIEDFRHGVADKWHATHVVVWRDPDTFSY